MSSETEQAPIGDPQQNIEKEQENKLRQKYPGLKGTGSSAFLHKRLSRGQKYFDSGDYNMAKAKGAMPPPPSVKVPTAAPKGQAIPKPATVETTVMTEATGDTIPTPESLPQRKPSLVQSKLVTETTS